MFGVDNRQRFVAFSFKGRLSEEADRAYRERHVANPHAEVMNYSPVGKIVRSDDILPLEDLRRTAFYNEVLRVQDVAHMAMVPLAAKEHFQVGCTICRTERQGPFGTEELRFISQLYRHLSRALLLGFRLEGYKALQRAEFHVLDRLSAAVILLDRSARVTFANTAARAMTASDGPLRLHNTVRRANSAPHVHQLSELLNAAVCGDTLVRTMSLPHPHDGRLFTVLVSSLRSHDIDRFGGFGLRDAAAMVVIHDPLRSMDIPVEWVMDAYGLTQAEARVALCTASGATIPETAYSLHVSPNTVKTHLRKVFAKTDTNRQAELARLLTSIGLLSAQAAEE
jgi:DNA-binding CsgD family transcriptional regulator